MSVLSSRDVNAPLTTSPTKMGDEKSSATLSYHRQVLQNKLDEKNQQTYVSPSDNILSPCTQKLTSYKNKHFMKAKPQSLFANMQSKQVDNAQGGSRLEKFGDGKV